MALSGALAGIGLKLTHPSLSSGDRSLLQKSAPAGMKLIPAGEFYAGANDEDADDDAKPIRKVYLPSFYMDAYEVTNREFVKFDPKHAFMKGDENLPASAVTYDEASAYAKWAGKRLPTNDEWEKAARGTDARKYPWGDTWDIRKVAKRRRTTTKDRTQETDTTANGKVCHVGPSRLQPVGSAPQGVSPFGCYDMAGNAWEWVDGYFNQANQQRLLRGGAVGYGERACHTYTRSIEGADDT